ncbi:hypothetical protein GCM10007382_11650 [Salinibacterium xinjiangense]|nr:hypothetical protein GCM10007382_11650 [Salinibacterium xinjiangense]
MLVTVLHQNIDGSQRVLGRRPPGQPERTYLVPGLAGLDDAVPCDGRVADALPVNLSLEVDPAGKSPMESVGLITLVELITLALKLLECCSEGMLVEEAKQCPAGALFGSPFRGLAGVLGCARF